MPSLVWLKLVQWFWRRIRPSILLFLNYPPLEKGMAFHLYLHPFYPRMLCANFLIDPAILKKKIFKFISSMYFHYFEIVSPWKKRSFEPTLIPFTQGCFVPSMVKIGAVDLEKKMKMWKVFRRADKRQEIRKAHLNFQLSWAKNLNVIGLYWYNCIIVGNC